MSNTSTRFDGFLPFKIQEPKPLRFTLMQLEDGDYACINLSTAPTQGAPVAVATPDVRGEFVIEPFDGQRRVLGVVTPLVSLIKEPARIVQAEESLFPALIDA